MALNAAILGYEYFPDPTKGRPVYFGSVYVGVVDLDPQIPANQLTIQYRQEDGTLVPATQPVLTGAGGVPLYNGSPVQIIVDGAYSMKVLNSSGAQVYYRADSSDNDAPIRDIITPFDDLTELRANTDSALLRAGLAGHTTEGDGGGGEFWLDTSDTSTADDNGINIVDSVSPRIGTWKRLYEGIFINPKWFGAIGDGVTDDTTAIQAAMNYCRDNKTGGLLFPEGDYLVTFLDYGALTSSQRYNIWGSGKNRTRIFKTDATAEPIMRINSTTPTFFVAEILMGGFRMEGQVATTTACIESYGIANCHFHDIWLEKSVVGWQDYGAISCTWSEMITNANQFGVKMQWFDSTISAGDPNANWFNNCISTNNTKWGFWFNDGRLVSFNGGRCEGNGQAALGADFGGVYIGQASGGRIGTENSLGTNRVDDEAVTGYGRAANISDMWFEGNIGIADIWFNGGYNTVSRCYFRTGSTFNVNDIKISNGSYRLENNGHSVDKTNVIDEGVNVQSGNIIISDRFVNNLTNINYDPDKTSILAVGDRLTPQIIAGGGFRVQGSDNVVVALGGYQDYGITSITRTGVGVFAVVLDKTHALTYNPTILITTLASSGAALPVIWSATALGVTGNFSLQLRRLDGVTNPLYDPTTDSVNRDFQIQVVAQ